jgi:hypothetical protein
MKSKMARHVLSLVLLAGLAIACARSPAPESVALDYSRALYARDSTAIYRLLAAADQRLKDEATFRRETDSPSGFALELSRRLGSLVTAEVADARVTGDQASVRLKLRLPDANAPAVAALAQDWDERRLNALPESERQRVLAEIAGLERSGRLPRIEGEETFALRREGGTWRVFVNWAASLAVRLAATVPAELPVEATFLPPETRVTPGQAFRVTLRLTNRSPRETSLRIAHHTSPERAEDALALVQCPLLLPVRLTPGETREFVSEYLALPDFPQDVPAVQVTYVLMAANLPGAPPAR